MLSVFVPAEQGRIARLAREEDRKLRIAAHLLSSTLLGERTGMRYRELPLRRGRYGKPYLEGGAVAFNAAHSGDLAVCALAEHTVGIDVERRDPLDAESVRALLGPRGVEDAGKRGQTGELEFFYERWTMLESWLKAEGTGLHDEHPLSSFAPDHDGTFFRAAAREKGVAPWAIETREVRVGDSEPYALAVCRRPEERPAGEVGVLDGNELIRRFGMLL